MPAAPHVLMEKVQTLLRGQRMGGTVAVDPDPRNLGEYSGSLFSFKGLSSGSGGYLLHLSLLHRTQPGAHESASFPGKTRF